MERVECCCACASRTDESAYSTAHGNRATREDAEAAGASGEDLNIADMSGRKCRKVELRCVLDFAWCICPSGDKPFAEDWLQPLFLPEARSLINVSWYLHKANT